MPKPTARQIARAAALLEKWHNEKRTVYAMAGFQLGASSLAAVHITGYLEVVLDSLVVKREHGFVHVVPPKHASSIRVARTAAGIEIELSFDGASLVVSDHELLGVKHGCAPC